MRFYVRLLLICAVLAAIAFPLSEQLQSATAKRRSDKASEALCAGTVKSTAHADGPLAVLLKVFAGPETASRLPWEASFGSEQVGLRSVASSNSPILNSPALEIVGLPSDHARPPLRSSPAPAQIVDVNVNSNFFSPQTVHITAGDTVRWTWVGSPIR